MNSSELRKYKGVKFVHINIRSIYKKIDQISCIFSDVDFLCFSESWLSDKYDNALISIPGMSIYRNDRSNASDIDKESGHIPKRGGGVAIYVKEKWSTYTTVFDNATVITRDFESICLVVKKPNNRCMSILCIYRPPTGSIDKLVNFFTEFLNLDIIRRTEIWILGDFNINSLVRNHPDVMKLNKVIRENSLKQLIHQPTRLNYRGGTCIDWIITSSEYISQSGVLDDLLSDHFPIYTVRKKEREHVHKIEKRVRVYKKFDAQVFENLLVHDIDWNVFYAEDNPDVLWDTVINCITGILEIMCPFKNIFVRENRSPWFTQEIYESIYKRSYYVRLFRKTGNQDIFVIAKHFRNRCNRLVREAKRQFIKTNLEINRLNPRKFWRTLNSILKPDNNKGADVEFFDKELNRKVPLTDTCDFLNGFFANVGNRKYPNLGVFEDTNVEGDKLEIKNIGVREVEKLTLGIDVTKDSCVEGVSSKILKIAIGKLTRATCYLFNKSLSLGIFPRKWAIGYINILPKGGDKTDPSNWRPITQTCIPAKMLEKIVQCRFMAHLDTNNILSDFQYGFRKNRSTQQAIFELDKDVNLYLNNDEIIGLLFLDISKAFDSLDHSILLGKLRNIGLAGNIVKWFESYLNRKQVIRHNRQISQSCTFKNGIPQGSCLGPTLFIFYMNDVFKYMLNVHVLMFADDCVLYKSGKDWNDVKRCLQTDLDIYIEWGNDHNLSLNASKSKAMMICNKAARAVIGDPAPFNAGNRQIMFVHNYCYLGCVINDELTLANEYKALYRKVECKVYMLGKLRYYIDKKTSLLIYKQAVLPYFDYGGFLLVSANRKQIKDLQTLQNNALRISLRYNLVDRISEERLHREASLQSLDQRRKKQLMKLMYYQSKKARNVKKSERQTRAAEKVVFNIPSRCTTKFLSSAYYIGTQLWNELSLDVQRSENIMKFDKSISPLYNVYRK